MAWALEGWSGNGLGCRLRSIRVDLRILDCHCNWTAAWHLTLLRELDTPPCTVTMEFKVQLRRPTPSDRELTLTAWVTDVEGDIVTVESELTIDGTAQSSARVSTYLRNLEASPFLHEPTLRIVEAEAEETDRELPYRFAVNVRLAAPESTDSEEETAP